MSVEAAIESRCRRWRISTSRPDGPATRHASSPPARPRGTRTGLAAPSTKTAGPSLSMRRRQTCRAWCGVSAANADWYGFGPLWAIRGVVDKIVGGVGLRRGRRHPDDIAVGEALDFWRRRRTRRRPVPVACRDEGAGRCLARVANISRRRWCWNRGDAAGAGSCREGSSGAPTGGRWFRSTGRSSRRCSVG